MIRWYWVTLCSLWWLFPAAAEAQVVMPSVRNGDLELWSEPPTPDHWTFISPSGGLLKPSEDAHQGEKSALVDTLQPREGSQRLFSNLMQSIDAESWRGKRVRFRAAVKTSDLEGDAAAQLWFRVDRPRDADGKPQMGAFDNMQNRPIRDSQWKAYEIVLEIADDATRLVVGMFVLGKGRAWIDDVVLEEAAESTPTTELVADRPDSSSDTQARPSASRFRLPPAVQEAFRVADQAPQQPFFTHWLWLPIVAAMLFLVAHAPPRKLDSQDGKGPVQFMTLIPKFAFRFSLSYWVLYSFPILLSRLAAGLGSQVATWYQPFALWYRNQVEKCVTWTAQNIFKIESELVPPNGSGDTTYNYIQVFAVFVIALGVAFLWSLVDHRRTDHRYLKDLLHSYLRYVLAMWMLSYGMAKVAWDMNQFPTLSEMQLDKTWGDSSPMNVVWSFMGASRAYTVFAGLGELAGGLLLLFRHTRTLGALIVLGVMTNVMMLNYCYDVPVKLFSTHLVLMAVFLLLPDLGRLMALLVCNRPVAAANLRPPYANRTTIWAVRFVKLVVIVVGFAIPLGSHTVRQVQYFVNQSKLPPWLGTYEIEEFELMSTGGGVAETSSWRTIAFEHRGRDATGAANPTYWLTITLASGQTAIPFVIHDLNNQLEFGDSRSAVAPTGIATLTQVGSGKLEFVGRNENGPFQATLVRSNANKHRLTNRGYRWINEVPYNR